MGSSARATTSALSSATRRAATSRRRRTPASRSSRRPTTAAPSATSAPARTTVSASPRAATVSAGSTARTAPPSARPRTAPRSTATARKLSGEDFRPNFLLVSGYSDLHALVPPTRHPPSHGLSSLSSSSGYLPGLQKRGSVGAGTRGTGVRASVPSPCLFNAPLSSQQFFSSCSPPHQALRPLYLSLSSRRTQIAVECTA